MLVLERCPQEKIVVSGPCVITLIESRPGRAKIGIEAGKSVTIWRAELLDCDGKPKQFVRKGAE